MKRTKPDYEPKTEIEPKTAEFWLSTGAIVLDDIGQENSYYTDEFSTVFYSKNYPKLELA